MTKCPKCGLPLREGSKFCIECGTKIETIPTPTQLPTPQHVPQQPKPVYVSPPQVKKSKIGLIIGLIAIVVAIVLILLVVFFVFGGGLGISESTLFGTWNVESYGFSFGEWTFYQNGTLKMTYDLGDFGEWGDLFPTDTVIWTTWDVADGKLYLVGTSDFDVPVETGMTIVTSNGGNTVKLKYDNPLGDGQVTAYTLTKK
jgi:hypothetical protein